jgi:uncharacterized integral membrane protein
VSEKERHPVKYVYLALVVVLAGIVLLFKVQNLESVTVSLFSASLTLPVSMLILVVYVLGMLTGGAVFALLRALIHRASAAEK